MNYNKLGIKFFLILNLISFSVKSEELNFSIDVEQLKKHVEILSKQIIPRDYRSPDKLLEAAKYIQKNLKEATPNTDLQSFIVNGETYYNVVATLGKKTKDKIVIGAHYDIEGPYSGADDNASGVAGLIELAKAVKNIEFNHQILFVAYALEEPPYFASDKMGSRFHAKSLKSNNDKVTAMISLEMIGFYSDEANSQRYPIPEMEKQFPSVGNFIGVIGRNGEEKITKCVAAGIKQGSTIPVEFFNGPHIITGVSFSDHLSYWQEGYPAIMVTDTSFYRNENYHTKSDTIDTLNFKKMGMVVEGLITSIISLDQGCKALISK